MSLEVTQAEYTNRIADELQSLFNSGVFIAAASGNGTRWDNALVYPAKGPYAYAVGALNIDDTIASITSRGPDLDVLAPGNGLPFPSRSGNTYEIGGAATSYATPWITGTGAVIKQINPGFTPAQIIQVIKDSGVNVFDSASGLTFKRLDLDNAYQLASELAVATNPYRGLPFSTGQRIELEDFDNGSNGTSYNDTTPTTNDFGLQYRNEGVDIEHANDTDGGWSVGSFKAGEWTEYTLKVNTAGTYDLSARFAATGGTSQVRVLVSGVDKTGALNLPDTGGWYNWQTQTLKTGISLAAGTYKVRVAGVANNSNGAIANLNWIKLDPSTGATRNARSTIQAESFDQQSGGVTVANGNIGSLDTGDWVRYNSVDFGSGVSTFTMRYAVGVGFAGTMRLRVGSPTGQIIGTVNTQSTGGWGTFVTQTFTVTGTTGVQDLYFTFDTDGTANIDYFTFG
jgi:hypothetical protein